MADGSEDSYLYMKSRSRPFYELENGRIDSGKLPSSRIPKKVSADTQSSPSPNLRPRGPKAAVKHPSSSDIQQSIMRAPTAGPSNYDDCMAFDLYEQDPDMDFECEDYNLRRQSSDFRLNFEDMIVLPIRLKKPSHLIEFGTPPATVVDEFDFADQHVYYSQLITAVNSTTAIHEYSTRKGPLWDSAWEMLIPKGLHPAYLTEDEFVKLVLSQGNDTAKWMDINIPLLHRRALKKAAVAREKLSNAGISPFELTQEYLESFEWMDKIEQDNFIKTMQKLQLQVAFQKQGLSMRVEDIDNTTPVDDEKLIGKSHTKLVDGSCITRDYSSEAEVDESFMVDQISLAEFEDQFWDDDYRKASTLSNSIPIQETRQSPTDREQDPRLWETLLNSLIDPHSTNSDATEKCFEHVETREVSTDSDYAHQDTKTTYTIENGSLKLSQFPQLEASSPKCCSCSHVPPPLPPKNPDAHIVFSLQDPPPISPTRSAQDGHVSDSSVSVCSDDNGRKSSGNRSHMTKSSGSGSGSQSTTSGKIEGSGKSGKRDSIGRKLGDSPRSLKKKLSSVFGTIGRSGKNKYHVSLDD
ncbi:hypothetical protein DSL72_006122 [Monilinia vaccinii-corymbosi]|uniref:Uncharacterized protein n=1 Tax=Monilinia vaccinii-corymbosi TaxID=61207 RepID=A0A8A3PH25_9HELO|nr:hypothetical protein DSL72_006122 [Monilinia vaccinii-corymbosi]